MSQAMTYKLIFAYMFLFSKDLFGLITSDVPLNLGFVQMDFVSEAHLQPYEIGSQEKPKVIQGFCQKLKTQYESYGWKEDPCGHTSWEADFHTKKNMPLIYTTFGSGSNTTIFFGGVHPDEITPIPISFRLVTYLKDHPELYAPKTNHKVIVAPLVCPDGFFLPKPLRTNLTVDVNRNFLTQDWYDKGKGALDTWRGKRGAQDRYFPGFFPHTEIETVFQTSLISKFQANKIFSIHAPLGFYDFDGPGDQKTHYTTESEQRTKEFVVSLSQKSHDYKIVVYNVYPGSLGNYAGKERKIPTITLELEATSPSMVDAYWKKFLPGFLHSIHYQFTQRQ